MHLFNMNWTDNQQRCWLQDDASHEALCDFDCC